MRGRLHRVRYEGIRRAGLQDDVCSSPRLPVDYSPLVAAADVVGTRCCSARWTRRWVAAPQRDSGTDGDGKNLIHGPPW